MSGSWLTQALQDFNHAEAFIDHLSEDVVLEFPYGPTLGLPETTVGKAAVRDRLAAAQESGLRISSPRIVEIRGGGYLAEYTGTYRGVSGSTAQVPLLSILEADGAVITRIREYWDTLRIASLQEE